MRSFYLGLALFFFRHSLFAQSSIPPTPDVASLLKVSNFELNEFKGRADFQVPLYEIKAKGLNLPIKLMYSSSGIKAEEEAGWVGTSWSLLDTGVINRKQRGLPDNLDKAVLLEEDVYEGIVCLSGRVFEQSGWFDRAENIENDINIRASGRFSLRRNVGPNRSQNRGLQDILSACTDNLKGFTQAILSVYPKAQVKLYIVHQIHNLLKYVASKDQKEFMKDLKKVYRAVTKDVAEDELLNLEEKWGSKYPVVIESWQRNWEQLSQYWSIQNPLERLFLPPMP